MPTEIDAGAEDTAENFGHNGRRKSIRGPCGGRKMLVVGRRGAPQARDVPPLLGQGGTKWSVPPKIIRNEYQNWLFLR